MRISAIKASLQEINWKKARPLLKVLRKSSGMCQHHCLHAWPTQSFLPQLCLYFTFFIPYPTSNALQPMVSLQLHIVTSLHLLSVHPNLIADLDPGVKRAIKVSILLSVHGTNAQDLQ